MVEEANIAPSAQDVPVTNVLVLYTGGTIGMKKSDRGYVPAAGYMEKTLATLPMFHDRTQPLLTTPVSSYGKRVHYQINEYSPLLDSCNMDHRDWARVANDIYANYDDFDAFIVLHGTDTMAYTSSALSFMLDGLGKTVVVTGSQIPLTQPRNDGVENLLGALYVAGHFVIPEVTLFFSNQLLRGNRATKFDASNLKAFTSPNIDPLVTAGIGFNVAWERVLPPRRTAFTVTPQFHAAIGVLTLFPGLSIATITAALAPPMAGVVLQTFGAGNAPDTNAAFLAALREATDRGVVIVNVTQCHRGMVSAHYATGAALKEAGVTPGSDLTLEAALCKLGCLLGRGLTPDQARAAMTRSLRGELTETAADTRFALNCDSFVKQVYGTLRGNTVSAASAVAGEDTLSATQQQHGLQFVSEALSPVLLCSACGLGELDTVRHMVDGGCDVRIGDYDGRTPLHLAACEGHLPVVAFLLSCGADPNAVDRWGGTPLKDAVAHRHPEVAEALREAGGSLATQDLSQLLCALAQAGDRRSLTRMVDQGAVLTKSDYDGRTPLHLAAAEGHTDLVAYILAADPCTLPQRDRWGNTALSEAEARGHVETVAVLQAAAAVAAEAEAGTEQANAMVAAALVQAAAAAVEDAASPSAVVVAVADAQ